MIRPYRLERHCMTNDLGFIDPTAGGSAARIALRRGRWTSPAKSSACSTTPRSRRDVILQTVAEALRERYGVARGDHPAQGALFEARDRGADRRDGERGAGAAAALGG